MTKKKLRKKKNHSHIDEIHSNQNLFAFFLSPWLLPRRVDSPMDTALIIMILTRPLAKGIDPNRSDSIQLEQIYIKIFTSFMMMQ